MPRIRSIKPEFWSSPGIAKMNPWARLTFIAMWNWADDFGRGTYEPRELMGFVFPNDEDMTVKEFRRHVGEIRRHVGVEFYVVGGRHFYAIPSWSKHQKTDKRMKQSKFPAIESGTAIDPVNMQVISTVDESPLHVGESPRHVSVPQPLVGAGTGEQRNRGTEGGGTTPSNHLTARAKIENPLPQNFEFDPHPTGGAHAPTDATPDTWSTPDDPRCHTHAGLPRNHVPPCHACAQARTWFQTQATHHTQTRRNAIDACPWCDTRGIAETTDTTGRPIALKCNHQHPPTPQTAPNQHKPAVSQETRNKLLANLRKNNPTHQPTTPPKQPPAAPQTAQTHPTDQLHQPNNPNPSKPPKNQPPTTQRKPKCTKSPSTTKNHHSPQTNATTGPHKPKSPANSATTPTSPPAPTTSPKTADTPPSPSTTCQKTTADATDTTSTPRSKPA